MWIFVHKSKHCSPLHVSDTPSLIHKSDSIAWSGNTQKAEMWVVAISLIWMTLLYQPNIVYILFILFFRSEIEKNLRFARSRNFCENISLKEKEEEEEIRRTRSWFIHKPSPPERTKCVHHFFSRSGNSSSSADCRVNNIWQSMWNSTHHITIYTFIIISVCAYWLTNSVVDIPIYATHQKFTHPHLIRIYYYILCDPKLSFSRFFIE